MLVFLGAMSSFYATSPHSAFRLPATGDALAHGQHKKNMLRHSIHVFPTTAPTHSTITAILSTVPRDIEQHSFSWSLGTNTAHCCMSLRFLDCWLGDTLSGNDETMSVYIDETIKHGL